MFLTPEHLVEKLYLKAGDRVADFGAGVGAYTLALSSSVTDTGKVFAVDVNRDLLSTLEGTAQKMGYLNIETIWADLESNTFIEACSLQAVVLSNVLFQTEHPEQVVQEVARVLMPKGSCLCVDWSASHGGVGPHPSHVINEERAEALFTKLGFSIGERLPAGDFHYAFIAIAP